MIKRELKNAKIIMNPILKKPQINSRSTEKLKLFQRYFNKAVQYQSQNKTELAIELYEKALYHNTNHLPTLQALGLLLQQSEKHARALEYYHRAERLHTHSATINNAIADCYENCHQWDKAHEHYTKAIELRQDYAEALNKFGNLCRKMGDYQKAEFYLLRSLRLCISVPTLINLGLHMAELHNYTQAHSFFDHALRLQPFNNKIKWYKALSLLTEGEFKQGWDLYTNHPVEGASEQQTGTTEINETHKSENHFLNKHVHIKGKQSIDDEIMFSSCIPEIISLAKSCSIECDERLLSLFRRSFHQAEIIPKSNYPQTTIQENVTDLTISMVNIARVLRQSFNDFPDQFGYLTPSDQATQFWKKEYASCGDDLKVGIAWRSTCNDEINNNHCSLDNWHIMFENVPCQLINLQHGQISQELDNFPLPVLNWVDCDYQNNMEQLAGQITALDLVITSNNTIAHLAGALGKTVWIILPYAANWRWFNGKNPCPWYNNARLFKQALPHEWGNLLSDVNNALLKQRAVEPYLTATG